MTESNQTPTWSFDRTQPEMMESDTVIVVDDNDNVVGSASKKQSHVFSPDQSHGILHRAFSVFIFDRTDNRLLLHKRASEKITFPDVWTNTCCSHPLHGMNPPELDTPAVVRDGTVPGVKNAAVRKLQHELGIPASQLDPSKMKFLTRLHYWAADTVTHGSQAPWGEHEVDYVLFMTVGSKDELTLKPHPEEIQSLEWVTPEELEEMMQTKENLFSPWFRLIYYKWMKDFWWKNLQVTMSTDKFVDVDNIHEFDPPPEHLGGGGSARPLFEDLEDSKKQGGYGKVKIHKESKVKQIAHLDEMIAAVTLLYIKPLESNIGSDYVRKSFGAKDLAFCDEILVKVSRSFAAVIRQLPSLLLVDVLIFYLVLRALDTVEDDTTAFESNEKKIEELLAFHKNALEDPTWSMHGVGEHDERRLLEEFPRCHRVYASLRSESREVISDITLRMAKGMAEFVGKDLGQGTRDVAEYNRYCHFVAGLVGEGLSRLFASSGLEAKSMKDELHLSNQMGLFLQKTNIIRDYLEDFVDKRAFWPQSIWSKYSVSGDLGYFVNQDDPLVREKSLHCLNELVTDALELAPECLQYLEKLNCVEVFRFCAIPQVMAIATLDKCYHNSDVFTGVVKIRKGLSCKLILCTSALDEVHEIFDEFATSIKKEAVKQRQQGFVDPNFQRTINACEAILRVTNAAATRQFRLWAMRWVLCVSLLIASVVWQYLPADEEAVPSTADREGQSMVQTMFMMLATALFLFGPWPVHTTLKPSSVLSASIP